MAAFPDRLASRHALSARRHLGRARHQLRGVLRACRRASSSACSIRPAAAKSRASTLPECTDEVWHGYLPNAQPGPDLRLSRPRPLRAAARPSLQSAQAAARSLRAALRRRRCAGPMRCSAIACIRRAPIFPSTAATARPACRRPSSRDDSFRLGRRPAARTSRGRDTVIYEAHVRGMTMLRDDIRAARARHLRGAGRRRMSSIICGASASPRSSCCRSTPSCRTARCSRSGLRNYWGYNTLGFFAIEPRYLSDGIAQRNARRRAPAARRRHRGDPRRRLQPHRRGQRARADAVVPRPRQRQLLPAGAGQPPPLHQRHRHRQHAEPVASARAADGDGFAALLGDVVPCRRLPLRSRRHAGPRGRRLRSRFRLLRRAAPGPDPVAGAS